MSETSVSSISTDWSIQLRLIKSDLSIFIDYLIINWYQFLSTDYSGTTITKWMHLLMTNKPTKNINETRQPHYNANFITNYFPQRKSLFTLIPLQLALDCTENTIKNSTVELPLPTDITMDLLNLV